MSSKNAIDKANEKLLFEAENDKKLSCIENTKEVTIIAAAAETVSYTHLRAHET